MDCVPIPRVLRGAPPAVKVAIWLVCEMGRRTLYPTGWHATALVPPGPKWLLNRRLNDFGGGCESIRRFPEGVSGLQDLVLKVQTGWAPPRGIPSP